MHIKNALYIITPNEYLPKKNSSKRKQQNLFARPDFIQTHFQFSYWKLSMPFNLTRWVYSFHALISMHHNLYRNLSSHCMCVHCYCRVVHRNFVFNIECCSTKCARRSAVCECFCFYDWKMIFFLCVSTSNETFYILQLIWCRTPFSIRQTDFQFCVLKQSQPKNCIKCIIKIRTQIERKNGIWFVGVAVWVRSIKFANIFRITNMCVPNVNAHWMQFMCNYFIRKWHSNPRSKQSSTQSTAKRNIMSTSMCMQSNRYGCRNDL